uniref:Uncharacterized protein n=1 Tax=Arundo donax TaxID=35708 RepID=A0A0A8Z665_ARUDO
MPNMIIAQYVKSVGGKIQKEKRQVPHKVLCYFPLKPRLQRLFMSKEVAENT